LAGDREDFREQALARSDDLTDYIQQTPLIK
jgi:hypothetical protein